MSFIIRLITYSIAIAIFTVSALLAIAIVFVEINPGNQPVGRIVHSELSTTLLTPRDAFTATESGIRDERRVLTLNEDFFVQIDELGVLIRVPKFFETDFASVPAPISRYLSQFGRHSEAAVVHDWLYAVGEPGRRAEADWLFYHMMRENGVDPARSALMFAAVRFAGAAAYGRDSEWSGRFVDPFTRLRIPEFCTIDQPLSGFIDISEQYFDNVERSTLVALDYRPIGPVARRISDYGNYFGSNHSWMEALGQPNCVRLFVYAWRSQTWWQSSHGRLSTFGDNDYRPFAATVDHACSSIEAIIAQDILLERARATNRATFIEELIGFTAQRDMLISSFPCNRQSGVDYAGFPRAFSFIDVLDTETRHYREAEALRLLASDSVTPEQRAALFLEHYPNTFGVIRSAYVIFSNQNDFARVAGELFDFYLLNAAGFGLSDEELSSLSANVGQAVALLLREIPAEEEGSIADVIQAVMLSPSAESILQFQEDPSIFSLDEGEFLLRGSLGVSQDFARLSYFRESARVFLRAVASCNLSDDTAQIDVDRVARLTNEHYEGTGLALDTGFLINEGLGARRSIESNGEATGFFAALPGADWGAEQVYGNRERICSIIY